nr:PREDICTED: neural Wiskott-Aldrich syndrome protein-like [Bemisia tabaci]
MSNKGGGTENIGSSLLSKEENEQLFYLLGPRCFTLASTVVQLFSTKGSNDVEWHKQETGVLCLVKDNPRKSYFFRLYCINQKMLLWEHEIYNRMDYLAPRPFLHTFEGENCIIAFNFASTEEASKFHSILIAKLETKRQRRLEKRSRSGNQVRHMTQPVPRTTSLNQPSLTNGSMSSSPQYLSSGSIGQMKKKHKDKKRKTKFTKADIGLPQNFTHVQHVGWNPNRGFDVDNVEDPIFQEFFEKAGISEKDLEHKKTRDFIYSFIDSHGGVDAVKEDIRNPPPPVPRRTVLSGGSGRTAPPLPPSRLPMAPQVPPHTPPAPPPPVPERTVAQQTQHMSRISEVVAARPTEAFAPPPPPPPPPPMAPLVTAAAPSTSSVPPPPPLMHRSEGDTPSNSVDPHSALMESIRTGARLKHVEADTARRVVPDTRNELLDQIRQGVELKAVQPVSKTTASTVPPDSLAGALAKALAERAHALQSDSDSDSSSDDSDDDDEDWEE